MITCQCMMCRANVAVSFDTTTDVMQALGRRTLEVVPDANLPPGVVMAVSGVWTPEAEIVFGPSPDREPRAETTVAAVESRIAWALFRAEVQDEVMRISEMEPTSGGFLVHGDWDRVLRAMWTNTKLELRKRCEAKAADIVTLMAEPPEAL